METGQEIAWPYSTADPICPGPHTKPRCVLEKRRKMGREYWAESTMHASCIHHHPSSCWSSDSKNGSWIEGQVGSKRTKNCYFACSPKLLVNFLGIWHWKMAGTFAEYSVVSVSKETQHERSSKIRCIRSICRCKAQDKNKKSGVSFCNFSPTLRIAIADR